ncbi:RNA polymerase sigma factor [Parvicella tangerina]|uniref:ECF RNA polymerase sigma factor SigW n=1 Tax=Parvicella tangerina TaxID=2829795 RepID=A0A916ND99_9FLAO|nr:RNA polymerase sigma factor [Parvicella tangerina]CAG5084936.1 ECF RNA polymerase sigma factor SigW [Parvicella tangerina]
MGWNLFSSPNLQVDERTIKKIKRGDRKVILSLYNYVFDVLMSTAVRYKSNQEDQMTIVNNAFMKVIDKIDKFKVGTAFLSWTKRIVINEAIDDFRRSKKYKAIFDLNDDVSQEVVANDELDEHISSEVLLKMINQLPPATKVVFNLFAVDGLKNKEIAEELEITYETVKWHIKTARKEIRKQLSLKTA